MLEIFERRNLLETEANPGIQFDYVVTLQSELTGAENVFPARLSLRYVPDRLLLKPACLASYFQEIETITFDNLEQAAVLLMEDFNNELVPRWINMRLNKHTADSGTVQHHEATLEDRQPRWHNARLIERLERY
jgi:7-cyano-7-deazaguanine reductase